MKRIYLIAKTILVLAGVLACSALTQGQQRTFVASTGNDANNCSRATPCRNFQRAHDVVVAGGEVVALDSAGYGTVNINRSVTISGEGVRAAISTLGGTGVSITAPGATVVIRALSISGTNSANGNIGVRIHNAANVYIERCVVTGFDGSGISYETNNRLFVTDTVSRSNGDNGLLVNAAAGGTAIINVDGSRFEQNGNAGIALDEHMIEASITNSLMSGNGNHGVVIRGTGNKRANVAHSTAANNGDSGFSVGAAGALELNIESSIARGNISNGMIVFGGDTIRVSNSTVTNNGIGFNNAAGTFASRGNNTVDGNGTNLVGVLVAVNVL
jgi:parallel beta helix pectate lyase-like protein